MSVESETRIVTRLRKEILSLKSDFAKIQSDIASYKKKVTLAEASCRKTKSASTMKSKLNEIERHNKSIVSLSSKASDIQKKINKREYDLVGAEKKLETAKLKEGDKIQRETQLQVDNVVHEVQSQKVKQDLLHKEICRLKEPPAKITILFFASNPITESKLRLDEEARAIMEKIRLSEYRDTLQFETQWAVRPSDLFQAINETNPTIIHFSGHGSVFGEIVLQNPDGSEKLVSPDAISQAIATVSDEVKLVFFNACYSEIQAQNIVNYIDAAIGMSDAVDDDAACIFAAQFYSAIGFGLSVEQAFNQAKAELLLESAASVDVPQLCAGDEVNLSEMYLVKK